MKLAVVPGTSVHLCATAAFRGLNSNLPHADRKGFFANVKLSHVYLQKIRRWLYGEGPTHPVASCPTKDVQVIVGTADGPVLLVDRRGEIGNKWR